MSEGTASSETLRGQLERTGFAYRRMERSVRDATTAVRSHAEEEIKAQSRNRFGGWQGPGRWAARNLGALTPLGTVTPTLVIPLGTALTTMGQGVAALTQSLWLLPTATSAAAAGFGTMKMATMGLSDALTAMMDVNNPDKFATQLALLSPAAQQFVLSVQQLMPAFMEIRNAVQSTFFTGIPQMINRLARTYRDAFGNMSVGIAKVFNDMLVSVGNTLMAPGVQRSMAMLFDNIVKSFQALTPMVGPIVSAFAQVAGIGSQILPDITREITNLVLQFTLFIDRAARSGDLKKWMNDGWAAIKAVGEVLAHLGRVFYDIFGLHGQRDIDQFKATMNGLITGLGIVIGSLQKFFEGLASIIQIIADWPVGKLLGVINDHLGGIETTLASVIGLMLTAKIGVTVAEWITKLAEFSRTLRDARVAAAELNAVTTTGNIASGASGVAGAAAGGAGAAAGGARAAAGGAGAALGIGAGIWSAGGLINAFSSAVDGFIQTLNHGGGAVEGFANSVRSFTAELNLPGLGWLLNRLLPGGTRRVPWPGGKPQQPMAPGTPLGDVLFPGISPPTPGMKPGPDLGPLGQVMFPGGIPGVQTPLNEPIWGTGQPPNPLSAMNQPWMDIPLYPDNGLPVPVPNPGGGSRPNIPLSQYSLQNIPLGQFPGAQWAPPNAESLMSQLTPAQLAQKGYGYVVDQQAVFDAQSRLESVRNSVEEARARRLELEQDNTATEQDKIKAQNNIVEQERNFLKAQVDYLEAQRGTWKKINDSIRDQTNMLEGLGAQIDADFGISKGLPGIAENLTKFLANLVAAPVYGALAGVRAAGGELGGGRGLVGAAALGGMFGPQYMQPSQISVSGSGQVSMPIPTTGPGAGTNIFGGPPGAAPGPAGTGWGPSVATAPGAGPGWVPAPGVGAGAGGGRKFGPGQGQSPRPGESARDYAHRVMMPYWRSQGYDVSDHAADQYKEHQYGALDIMVPDIATGNQVLQQVLSDPNVYGAIFNRQSYGYGQGLGPRNYTGPNPHTDHVHAWWRPGNQGNINPGGIAPGGMQNFAPLTPAGGDGASLPALPLTPGGYAPPGTGPTQVGAVVPPPVGTGGGFGGASGGLLGLISGAVSTAISAGGMGADLAGAMGGGSAGAAVAGALAQIGIDEINRAIAFGGQAVGILTSGLMETFLPTGGSELANNNWLTRIVGGIVGMRPLLPNFANISGAASAVNQEGMGHLGNNPQGTPGPGNQVNVQYNSYNQTEDENGKALAYHIGKSAGTPMPSMGRGR